MVAVRDCFGYLQISCRLSTVKVEGLADSMSTKVHPITGCDYKLSQHLSRDNVIAVETKVEMRFNVQNASWIPNWIKPRLIEKVLFLAIQFVRFRITVAIYFSRYVTTDVTQAAYFPISLFILYFINYYCYIVILSVFKTILGKKSNN